MLPDISTFDTLVFLRDHPTQPQEKGSPQFETLERFAVVTYDKTSCPPERRQAGAIYQAEPYAGMHPSNIGRYQRYYLSEKLKLKDELLITLCPLLVHTGIPAPTFLSGRSVER